MVQELPLPGSARTDLSNCRLRRARLGFLALCVISMPFIGIFACGLVFYGKAGALFAVLRDEALLIDGSPRYIGSVAPSRDRIVYFDVLNLRSKPVTVVGAQSTCGCAQLQRLPLTIDSRQTSKLELLVRPTPTQAGKDFRQRILLLLDVPSSPLILEIDGIVDRDEK